MTSPTVSFSHVELYVDKLGDLSVYKYLEQKVNDFSSRAKGINNISTKKKLWGGDISSFVPHDRDFVKQLIVGVNFRITRVSSPGRSTRSVLMTSSDTAGVQFLVTAPNEGNAEDYSDDGLAKYRRFLDSHGGHCGIGVLAFRVSNVEGIKTRYEKLHAELVSSYLELPNHVKILEVFAYYENHTNSQGKKPDLGTVLRFVQAPADDVLYSSMGLKAVEATFDSNSHQAYFDHWVSNVFSRTEFIETLHDTLGFSPKVDFNAGVVAAGEAQIESTVTGNTSLVVGEPEEALRDQSQVYLPINNSLSPVGHVHGFLQELGQGVQHIASRVKDIVGFVQDVNDRRQITGEGFSFLRIPRSYYGVLALHDLVDIGVEEKSGFEIIGALRAEGVLENDGALDLDLTQEEMDVILKKNLKGAANDAFLSNRKQILEKLCFSRYQNLFSLLGSHVSETKYLAIVRNQILVDIQGEDLLYQIFTCNILQRNAGDEAPFLEFIQRVCSECKDENGCFRQVKPGCGGFGIRNFLTLFLSIEVSKAMQEVSDARDAADAEREAYAQKMVDCFTSQLNEANPILTDISNAMTEEGKCKEMIASFNDTQEVESISEWEVKEAAAARRKEDGNARLMACSSHYNEMMKSLRETRTRK